MFFYYIYNYCEFNTILYWKTKYISLLLLSGNFKFKHKFNIKENICDSTICLNNGKCSELNGTCLCLTQEYYGDSCQYCKLYNLKVIFFL